MASRRAPRMAVAVVRTGIWMTQRGFCGEASWRSSVAAARHVVRRWTGTAAGAHKGGVSPGAAPDDSPSSPAPFTPRTVYEPSTGVPRSYFLGHHRAALDRMRRELATVGLVIECRDLRVPLTAWNPLLESSLMGTGVAVDEGGGGAAGGTGTAGGERARSLPGLSGPVRAAGPSPLAGGTPERTRIIVYTKRDLVMGEGDGDGEGAAAGGATPGALTAADLQRLAAFHRQEAAAVLFLGAAGADAHKGGASASSSSSSSSRREMGKLVAAVRAAARRHGEQSLTGLRALVVGMPNAGKSTLLNRLRARGMVDAGRRAKAAATGSQPGVTRKLGTPVRVLEGDDAGGGGGGGGSGSGGGVLVVDTPGVFLPYVADAESMLKLALVGCVREGLVPAVALADYLLFQLNQRDPQRYVALFGLAAPTEDVHVLLDAVARRTGKLGRGGAPAHEAAAQHLVTAWRRGKLGRFCLDRLDADALAAARAAARQGPPLSLHQARKQDKARRKARVAARRTGAGAGEAAAAS